MAQEREMLDPKGHRNAFERARLVAALRERVERLNTTGDPASILNDDAETESEKLSKLIDVRRDPEAAQAIGMLHWKRYQLSPESNIAFAHIFQAARFRLLDIESIGIRLGLESTVALYRFLLEGLDSFEEFTRSGNLDALNEAMRLFRQVLEILDASELGNEHYDDDLRNVTLKYLSLTLRNLFIYTQDLATLNEAIQLGREAVSTYWRSSNLEAIATRKADLAHSLQARFMYTKDQASLDEAVDLFRQVLDATPSDEPAHTVRKADLAHSLQARFMYTKDQASLDEAIDLFRQVLDATPDNKPERAVYLSDFARAMQERFVMTKDLVWLYEAIRLLEASVYAANDDGPGYVERVFDLAHAKETWFEQTRESASLGEAIELFRQATDLTPIDHPKRAARLLGLTSALHTGFEVTGEKALAAEAVRLLRPLVAAQTPDSPHYAELAIRLDRASGQLREHAPVLRVSIRYPRRLSMGYAVTFLVQIYPPTRGRSALRRGDTIFGDAETTQTGDNVQLSDTDVELELSCSAMSFSNPVRRRIPPIGADVAFWGQPVESARPGRQSGRLAIRDPDGCFEYHSIPFEVDIVDYAFDHLSRPSAGRIVAGVLAVASLVLFVIALATQTHLVIGLVASGVSGALSAFLSTRMTTLYRRPSVTATGNNI